MSYFIFNGKDSREFGILESVPIPPKAERTLQTVEIPGRLTPLNKINYEFKNIQLSFVLGITDHSAVNDINNWLNGGGKLILSSDTTKYYNAYIHSAITPERLSVRFGKIPITFTAEPFRYDIQNDTVNYTFTGINNSNPEKTITVTAGGSYPCEPLYYVKWSGRLEITVNGGEPLIIDTDSNLENGEYTDSYTGGNAGETPIYHYECPEDTIFIDAALKVAYKLENGVKKVCCEMTSGKFPMLEPGENSVKFKLLNTDYVWEHTMSDDTVRQYKCVNQSLSVFDITPNSRWL